jgi:NAD(P)-dependent dehydrogenase (short-subunit alcohol dehydrogenase family)
LGGVLADERQPQGLGLSGKVAVVTGGAQGIGRACVIALAREGAAVVCVDNDGNAAGALMADVTGFAGGVVVEVGDVREAADLERAAQRASALGGADILVNNVGGLLGTEPTPTLDVDEGQWAALADFNLRPTFLGCQVFARHMIDRGQGGSIVNISASLALRAAPQLAAYAAAKAGVDSLTRTLAVELAAHGIRVNAVSPAFTDTPSTVRYAGGERRELTARSIPLGRVGQPEDMAGTVLFLASPLSAFVTGQTMLVDGGLLCTTLRPPRGWVDGKGERG